MSIFAHSSFKYIFRNAVPLKVGNAYLNLAVHTPTGLLATLNRHMVYV